nr:symplekin [Hymenolepis microstoma]
MSGRVRVNQFDRVVGILRQAALSNDMREKLDFLHQVRELILKFDRSLLDSFFEEVVAFQHCPHSNLKLFVVKFIEDACVEDPRIIKKSVICLSNLYSLCLHSEPPTSVVIQAIIDAMKTIYRLSLTRAIKLGVIESGAVSGGGIEADSLADISLETFRSVVTFKDEIFRLLVPSAVQWLPGSNSAQHNPMLLTRLCASLNDSVRVSIINFIEVVILHQSRRPNNSNEQSEITLDQIPDLTNNLLRTIVDASTAQSSLTPLPGICIVRPRRLADESDRLLSGLMKLPLKQSDDFGFASIVTGPVFEALIDTIVSIARQRPQFFNLAVQSFECIHVNLPPHFSQAEVNSARWKLKSALLCLLQNSSEASHDWQSRIVILLTDLGATQQEISSVIPVLSAHGTRSSQKRGNSAMLDEEEEEDVIITAQGHKRSRVGSVSIASASGARDVSGSSGASVASIEEIALCLVPKLTGPNVADLVLLSMVNLPTNMPPVFNSTYTPIAAAGTNTQVSHLARLLAAQLSVWVNDEDPIVAAANRDLLGQLLESGSIAEKNIDTGVEIKPKKAYRQSKRQEKIDEDDEDAFMRDHVARVHTSKPMNISVVQGASAQPGIVTNKPSLHPTTGLLSTAGITRPFSLDRMVVRLPTAQKREFVLQTFQRILKFEPSKSKLNEEGHVLKHVLANSPHLSHQEKSYVKILSHLLVHGPFTKNLYNTFIEYVMSNLKDNFDPLVSLVVYEYTHFRGFSFEGVIMELLKSRAPGPSEDGNNDGTEGGGDQQDESNDEARRLLLESQRQLMALRAREGNDESDQIESRMNPLRCESRHDEAGDDAVIKPSRTSVDGERSLVFYDNMIIDILYRFSDASIKAPYFGRFLFEVPFLTTRVITFLRQYCTLPDNAEYGFEVVRNLIELKQTQWREELLNLFLGFSAHENQTVQKAAIKSACQLAQSSSKWEQIVEHRAIERMKRILEPEPKSEMFADLFIKLPELTDKWTTETFKLCGQLFLGLLPQNPGKLLPALMDIYMAANDAVRLLIIQNIDKAMCKIGLKSPHLLHLLDNCPANAEPLITRMLRVLTDPRKVAPPNAQTDPIMPPKEVVDRMRWLYRERANDVRFIVPVIVGLTKQEVIELLPRIFQLNEAYIKEVISRLLRASVATQPPPDPHNPNERPEAFSAKGPLTPEDLLVAIHLLEFAKDPDANPNDPSPSKPYIDIRVILQGCMNCFSERSLYTQERLSVAIGQLLERPVIPTLFLRTVMQAHALYPRLSGYVINVLFRLIQKQFWKSEILWAGFIRCCVKIQPKSYQVLLQLPPQQLEAVFKREPDLRTQLRRYVDTFSSAQRTNISRGVYEVLEREEKTEDAVTTEESASQPPSELKQEKEEQVIKAEEKEHSNTEREQNADVESSGAATPVCDESEPHHVEESTTVHQPNTQNVGENLVTGEENLTETQKEVNVNAEENASGQWNKGPQ